ncbi:hypothetical protein GCM10011571_12030 [Marinithermofilum abyssi]|uniref:N-acetyltransferase domain-containing protein n=1 Tax=Marinithermofilum abyssi TaxID=1571185 RepID=A0A8J2VH62_9BACL|nr:GNAT family N-acetyltransferase [Marinithermofilum abyssi]GGE12229.1 hypothetical protein GCM10011571_12030 [Marinithermofilum abyssi]
MKFCLFETLPTQKVKEEISSLHYSIFQQPLPWEVLQTKESPLIQIAEEDACVVGYKIGYEEKRGRFYSWIGGVSPAYRGKGIASTLMRTQHQWCKENGYTEIMTKTKNKWRNMLILNLKHGFDIIGTYTDHKGEPKLILSKSL